MWCEIENANTCKEIAFACEWARLLSWKSVTKSNSQNAESLFMGYTGLLLLCICLD